LQVDRYGTLLLVLLLMSLRFLVPLLPSNLSTGLKLMKSEVRCWVCCETWLTWEGRSCLDYVWPYTVLRLLCSCFLFYLFFTYCWIYLCCRSVLLMNIHCRCSVASLSHGNCCKNYESIFHILCLNV